MALENVSKVAAPTTEGGITRSDLVRRLGNAPGNELFERIDPQSKEGTVVLATTVREARKSFSAIQVSKSARLVSTRASKGGVPSVSLLLISLVDFEAVVRAAQHDFDWAAEFAPRTDLAAATGSLSIRSGAKGRRMLVP